MRAQAAAPRAPAEEDPNILWKALKQRYDHKSNIVAKCNSRLESS
ncbi:hypothetical protein GUJ93_ZPchr0001g30143 [Zizania palustris]|uniref:Uncharacterized protein n=1 Tax=Zizania palustris TaxID=103762 RepID=A0A8J5R7F7_ZIZPA|nr:hypothetical protein GUJ93_ZPchr0001g30143 [Zizania palustris]